MVEILDFTGIGIICISEKHYTIGNIDTFLVFKASLLIIFFYILSLGEGGRDTYFKCYILSLTCYGSHAFSLK